MLAFPHHQHTYYEVQPDEIINLLHFIFFAFAATKATAQSNLLYDIVLTGGRVIDPETKLDAVKNVGIINNRIARSRPIPSKNKSSM